MPAPKQRRIPPADLNVLSNARKRLESYRDPIGIRVLQHPQQGKAFNSNLHARGTRWPVEPPPVVELVSGPTGSVGWINNNSPNFFCTATLEWLAEEGDDPRDDPPEPALSSKNLVGASVASLHSAKLSLDQKVHGLFVFGDLNVKHHGVYRLKFELFEMRNDDGNVYASKINFTHSRHFTIIKSSQSSNLPPLAATVLTKNLIESGAKIRTRKQNRRKVRPQQPWTDTMGGTMAYHHNHAMGQLAHGSQEQHHSGGRGEDIAGRFNLQPTMLSTSMTTYHAPTPAMTGSSMPHPAFPMPNYEFPAANPFVYAQMPQGQHPDPNQQAQQLQRMQYMSHMHQGGIDDQQASGATNLPTQNWNSWPQE